MGWDYITSIFHTGPGSFRVIETGMVQAAQHLKHRFSLNKQAICSHSPWQIGNIFKFQLQASTLPQALIVFREFE